MQAAQRGTHRATMRHPNPTRPDTRQERGYRRMLPAQRPPPRSIPPTDRLRTDQTVLRQMLHQADEPRQVARIDPLLIQRQKEVTAGGAQGVIRVLDPLGHTAK